MRLANFVLAAASAPGASLRFPEMFFIAGAGLVGLMVETWVKRRQPWALPAAFVYFTIAVWYFADLFISPENYNFLPGAVLQAAYLQVTAFLIGYRLLIPWLTARFGRNAAGALRRTGSPSRGVLFAGSVVFWFVLISYGIIRMNGDVFGALVPLDARSGNTMWQREAAGGAGPTGFVVSTATYLHLLVSASFGVWWFFLRLPQRLVALGMMALSWPYFLLCGTRSVFLAVSMPFFFAYLLYGRHKLYVKLVCLAAAFFMVDTALRAVIAYRDVGFRNFFVPTESNTVLDNNPRHEGLNMIQELCFTDAFTASYGSDYGARYLADLANVIPRALWPNKPLLNIDYAKWRGFEGGDSDIDVVATISAGMIGGGVLNFGPWLGPFAPAVLMALWTALLARWWQQRASFLRNFLFLIGLGLTFNLGREITLLVLWPIVFGYVIVRFVEKLSPRAKSPARRRVKIVPISTGPQSPGGTAVGFPGVEG